jgi:hypothetical protein
MKSGKETSGAELNGGSRSVKRLVGMPALPARLYRCLTNWRAWRECRKIDKAAVVLWKGDTLKIAAELKALSDARWQKILRHPKQENQRTRFV